MGRLGILFADVLHTFQWVYWDMSGDNIWKRFVVCGLYLHQTDVSGELI